MSERQDMTCTHQCAKCIGFKKNNYYGVSQIGVIAFIYSVISYNNDMTVVTSQ